MLANALRKSTFSNNVQMAAIRGPKKKGGADSGPVAVTDIVNIFKERKDPVIVASHLYPPYLMDMVNETYTHDDIMWQLYRGERIPNHKEQWSLAKSMKRTFLVDGNHMSKRDYEFDSSDDEGEDLGQDIRDEDYEDEMEDGEGGGEANPEEQ